MEESNIPIFQCMYKMNGPKRKLFYIFQNFLEERKIFSGTEVLGWKHILLMYISYKYSQTLENYNVFSTKKMKKLNLLNGKIKSHHFSNQYSIYKHLRTWASYFSFRISQKGWKNNLMARALSTLWSWMRLTRKIMADFTTPGIAGVKEGGDPKPLHCLEVKWWNGDWSL